MFIGSIVISSLMSIIGGYSMVYDCLVPCFLFFPALGIKECASVYVAIVYRSVICVVLPMFFTAVTYLFFSLGRRCPLFRRDSPLEGGEGARRADKGYTT